MARASRRCATVSSPARSTPGARCSPPRSRSRPTWWPGDRITMTSRWCARWPIAFPRRDCCASAAAAPRGFATGPRRAAATTTSRSSRRSRSPAAPIACEILHLPGAAIDRAPVACRDVPTGGRPRHALGAGAQSLAIPPVLDLIDHCERERFDRVLVSGLGPMAAAARGALPRARAGASSPSPRTNGSQAAVRCRIVTRRAAVRPAALLSARELRAASSGRARVGAGELPAAGSARPAREILVAGDDARALPRARRHSRAPRASARDRDRRCEPLAVTTAV